MKIEDIKPVGYLLVRDRYGTPNQRFMSSEGFNMNAFAPFRGDTRLYTTEQMGRYAEAYAFEEVWELVNWYVESTADANHAAEMKVWIDDEFGEMK